MGRVHSGAEHQTQHPVRGSGNPAAALAVATSMFLLMLLAGCTALGTAPPPTAAAGAVQTEPLPSPSTQPPATETATAPTSPTPAATATPTPAAIDPETGAIRIEFGAGGSGATIEGRLDAGTAERYVLYAFAGQIMRVHLDSFGTELRIRGADGEQLAGRERHDPFWRGELPTTQDYLIEISYPGSEFTPAETPFRLELVIVPLGRTTQPLVYQDEVNGFELTYSDYFAFGQPPPVYDSSGEQIPLSLTFTGTDYFSNTNLAEASVVVSTHSIEPGAECAFPQFNGPIVSAEPIEISGMPYQQVHAAGIAAGNYYELISHSTPHQNTCFSITFYIHSVSIGAQPPGSSEFDRAGLMDHLGSVLASFRFLDD